MTKIGIFFGSSTGYTTDVANRIAEKLGVPATDVHDVADTAPSAIGDYNIIILGSSTWGSGDMQDNWEDFINGAEELDLEGKKIAIFGCGDETMSDTFNDAMGKIYERMKKTGAKFIAPFNTDGYTFNHCGAIVDGNVIGMPLDEVNHPDLTDAKIEAWTKEIKDEE